ncbi:MAG: cyanophycin synthetase [Candidatus Levybacteria bacterium]|nr:cyanophycin synthetase [Candidatus Levybacteria bacterium]
MGRADIVYDKDFRVMIDFAHTPNAIDQILKSVRPIIKGRIIHVFGSAGLRDITKRPIMGEMSSKYSDVIVLTAEDPRKEPIEKIVNDIKSGILGKKNVLIIPDRKKAIFEAIKIAKKGDFVILTGKSHEKSMNYGKGEVAWDEYKVVKDALKQFNNIAI